MGLLALVISRQDEIIRKRRPGIYRIMEMVSA